ncbi:MAG: hypothetical protein HY236_06480, partial [Acidobacteria bacterium]|nr:hypothetical protein [Acidobacteriota bacterium]
MTRPMLRSLGLALFSLAGILAVPQAVQAGPPLICHPLDTGGAKSLP